MSPGEWLGTGEGLPLINVLAAETMESRTMDVESGVLGWCWPHNTAPLRRVGYWLRARLSYLIDGRGLAPV